MKIRIFSLIFCLALVHCGTKSSLRFSPHRWMVDKDRIPIKEPVARKESKIGDFVDKQVFYQLERSTNLAKPVASLLTSNESNQAYNVTNFDEVFDSTWFTNRIGRTHMTLQQIADGFGNPHQRFVHPPWTIFSAKTSGVTPGLFIQDGRGELLLIKFDPSGHKELASGVDVIGSRIFYAIGYNVPNNYIVEFNPSILKITPKSKQKDSLGNKISFTQADLKTLLSQLEKGQNGKYRALVSTLLKGESLGPFSYRSKRLRDSNDRLPHQHRRELRGLRVFASWLNHTDTRETNSLDMFIRYPNSQLGYVQHNLIDFGGILGSGSTASKEKNHLYDYKFNYGRVLASLLSGGLYTPYWNKAGDSIHPAIGLFESELFEPGKWKPTYPNPAFQALTVRDGFWAAKIITNFSDQAIKAIVKEAKYSDPFVTNYITRTLIERRNKIGRYWFGRVNPLDDFEITQTKNGYKLFFKDLACAQNYYKKEETQYKYYIEGKDKNFKWIALNNNVIYLDNVIVSPLKKEKLYRLVIQTRRNNEDWSPSLDLFLKKSEDLVIHGIKRHSR